MKRANENPQPGQSKDDFLESRHFPPWRSFHASFRQGLALLLPLVACGVQWELWGIIKPFVWFLFYPAVFFSSRLGGWKIGIASTVLSSILVVFFFIPPSLSFEGKASNNLFSVVMFLGMGGLFSLTHHSLEKAKHHAAEALEASRLANAQLKISNDQVAHLYQNALRLDELKSQFFANVSHELRTPLTLILGPIRKRLEDPSLNSLDRKALEVVERNARILYRQVTNLLDVAKLEAGKVTLRYANVEFVDLVLMVSSCFESLATDKAIRLRVETPPTLVTQMDPEKIRRVLLNLLANAFKFTPSGGEIAVILEQRDQTAVLSVLDTGIGIPPDKRKMVFERFSQIDGGTERRHGGTGLGLAISKEFTELHRGTIEVTESPAGGAQFMVTLPLIAPEPIVVHTDTDDGEEPIEHLLPVSDQGNESPAESTAVGDAPLILVVEDNRDMNRYLTGLLEQNYRVIHAFDGEEGLAKALSLQPDLLISDVMMPILNGERMVQALRSHAGMASLPIIVLSAKADDELRVRLLADGVQEFLTKPFEVDELLARVHGLLSARRISTEEVRQSEERLRLALDATSDGIWDWDLTTGVVYRSPRYYELIGRHSGAGTNDFDFFKSTVHPDDLPHVLATINAHKDGKIPAIDFEYRLATTDGELKWMQGRGKAVARDPNGTPLRIVGTLTDVTARKQAQEKIRESEASLKQAQALAHVGSWIWDTRTNEHTWSEEVYRIYGRDPALPAAVYPEVASYFTPESWTNLSAAVEAGLTQGVPYSCDAEVVRPDGTHRWIVAQGTAERDENGNITQLHGTVHDITDRKLAEEKIQLLNNSLEARVEARTAELLVANQELESFSYAVSHDLRAPLRAMIGFSHALEEDYGDQLHGESRAYLDHISRAGSHMGELIDGLLALSRSTRGDLRRDPVDLSQIAIKLRDQLHRENPERLVTWEIESGLQVHGDGRMLEAVMRNLIENAWKYTLGTTAPTIRVGTESWDGTDAIFVADNGAGFDMRHADRLFKPFQRLHRQDEFPGIGIGLATVQRIIHRHGGEIHASSAPGLGAKFSFTVGNPTQSLSTTDKSS